MNPDAFKEIIRNMRPPDKIQIPFRIRIKYFNFAPKKVEVMYFNSVMESMKTITELLDTVKRDTSTGIKSLIFESMIPSRTTGSDEHITIDPDGICWKASCSWKAEVITKLTETVY